MNYVKKLIFLFTILFCNIVYGGESKVEKNYTLESSPSVVYDAFICNRVDILAYADIEIIDEIEDVLIVKFKNTKDYSILVLKQESVIVDGNFINKITMIEDKSEFLKGYEMQITLSPNLEGTVVNIKSFVNCPSLKTTPLKITQYVTLSKIEKKIRVILGEELTKPEK